MVSLEVSEGRPVQDCVGHSEGDSRAIFCNWLCQTPSGEFASSELEHADQNFFRKNICCGVEFETNKLGESVYSSRRKRAFDPLQSKVRIKGESEQNRGSSPMRP